MNSSVKILLMMSDINVEEVKVIIKEPIVNRMDSNTMYIMILNSNVISRYYW